MTTTEAFAALMPEPAAYCAADNPLNNEAFAWTGTLRGAMHTAPLYTAAQMRAMFDAATERAAVLCEVVAGRASFVNNYGASLAAETCAAAIRAREDGVAG